MAACATQCGWQAHYERKFWVFVPYLPIVQFAFNTSHVKLSEILSGPFWAQRELPQIILRLTGPGPAAGAAAAALG